MFETSINQIRIEKEILESSSCCSLLIKKGNTELKHATYFFQAGEDCNKLITMLYS